MGMSLEQRVAELEKKVQELTRSKIVKIANGLGIGDNEFEIEEVEESEE